MPRRCLNGNEVLALRIQSGPMSFDGKSFGRREGARQSRKMPSDKPAILPRPIQMALILGAVSLLLVGSFIIFRALPEMARLDGEQAQARQRVVAIVNQPVRHLPRTAEAAVFSPGWFHPGADTPDFGSVDVRETQEFPYQRYVYVTSDVNPTEMFIGTELEFNAMTKYFYVDRTLPKKRLSGPEMLEINQLYRNIGRDQQALTQWRAAMFGMLALVLAAAGAPLLFARRMA